MEFQEVVRRRRMVRRFTADPVETSQVDRMLDNAVRAPSAGFSQGWSFVVLDQPADVERYWSLFGPDGTEGSPEADDAGTGDGPGADDADTGNSPGVGDASTETWTPDAWLRGMMTAPVLIIPCSSKAAYLSRYAENDKGWTDQDEARWAVPYWHMDTAMAVMLILQTVVDEGLGACYFGIPPGRLNRVRATFDIPPPWDPIGVVAVGHPDLTEGGAKGSANRRTRREQADVVHRGRWGGAGPK